MRILRVMDQGSWFHCAPILCCFNFVSFVHLRENLHYMKTLNAFLIMNAILLICHTAEAQTEWQKLTTGSQMSVRNINFAGPLTGFAVGGGILRTNDAGRTWNSLYSTGPFYAAYFLAPDTGFVCVPGGYAERTTDGCSSWNNGTSMGTFEALFFSSRDTGFAAGGMGTSPGIIAKTTDQGASWSYRNLGDYGEFHSVFFCNPQLGFAAGGYHFTTQQQVLYYSGLIYRTGDGGNSWQNVFSAPDFLYSVYFPSISVGYATGDSGKVWKSVDAGFSWNLCAATGHTNKLYSVSFVTVDTGYVAGAGGLLLKTTDGGNNWTTEDLSVTSDFYSLYLNPSGGALYLSGYNGNIFVRGTLPYSILDLRTIQAAEVTAMPNPFTESTTLVLRAGPGLDCTIELCSPEGRTLLQKTFKTDNSGTSLLKISGASLPPGVSFYRIIVNGKVYTGKLIRL